jgi:hypothetical protein
VTEEQLRRDLGVRLSVTHQRCHLQLSLRERAETVALTGRSSTMEAASELPQLALSLIPIPEGSP